jgi:hypothetical protein
VVQSLDGADIFHSTTLSEAQRTVDMLVERRHPLVWESEGVRRVLDPGMNKSNQALVLLYSIPGWSAAKALCDWVEYSSLSLFKSNILKPLHKTRMIEYDASNSRAQITPVGIQFTENELLPK